MGSYQKAPQKGITELQYLLQGSFVLFLFQLTIEYCICPYCQGNLEEIGATIQRQELDFVPSQLTIDDYIQCAYNTMDISYI